VPPRLGRQTSAARSCSSALRSSYAGFPALRSARFIGAGVHGRALAGLRSSVPPPQARSRALTPQPRSPVAGEVVGEQPCVLQEQAYLPAHFSNRFRPARRCVASNGGKVCSPAPRARETLSAPIGGSVGVLNLGYPRWLLTAVIVVFAALLWFTLGGWKRPRIVVPLVSVLAPVCAFAAVFVAMALSLAITESLKPPKPPQEGGTDLRKTPERTRSATTRSAEPASPTVAPSPAATASATPSASPSASPGARTPR
jgi:hypothetical protein